MSETTTVDTGHGEPIERSETSAPPNALSGAPTPEPAAPEPLPEPEPAKPRTEDPYQKRIRQLTAGKAAEARRADSLAAELAAERAARGEQPAPQPAPGATPQSPAEIERMVNERAVVREEQRRFNVECNKIAEAGAAEFKDDFLPAMQSLWIMVDGFDDKGALTPRAAALIEASMETEKPAALLYHLGKNPDEATRIAGLTPAKMGAAVEKLSASLARAAVTPKPVSRAPAPIEPVSGNARADAGPLGPKDTGEWIKWREEQLKATRPR